MAPFIIYALPRSRTRWLSAFLSYRDWQCHHEQAMYMRNMGDVKALFSKRNTGSAETAAAPGRCLIRQVVPEIKEIVVLRPVEEVVASVMNIDISDVGHYERPSLCKGMEYMNRAVRKIAKDPNVLTVNFSDLDKEEACAQVFEHCLPYPFDRKWWKYLKDRNIQVDTKAILRYRFKNHDAIEDFKKYCKAEIRNLCYKDATERGA